MPKILFLIGLLALVVQVRAVGGQVSGNSSLTTATEFGEAASEIVQRPSTGSHQWEDFSRLMERSNEELQDHLKILEISFPALLTLAIIIFGLLQWKSNHLVEHHIRALGEVESGKLKNELELLKREWREFESKMVGFRSEVRIALEERDQDLEEKVRKLMRVEYQSRFADPLALLARESAQKIAGQSRRERDLLMARLRTLCWEVRGALEGAAPERPERIKETLGNAVRDWHVLGLLFSLDEGDIANGLSEYLAHPFVEARSRIEELLASADYDATILRAAEDALAALRAQGVVSANAGY